jgi:hypothetical protein
MEYEFDFFHEMTDSLLKIINFNMTKFATAMRVSQVDGKEYNKVIKDVFPLSSSAESKVDSESIGELFNLSKNMR